MSRVKRLRHVEEDLPPELATDSFLSRLTYGAMAVWGVGETLDSIPSLMGLFGLRFMVYSGGVWFLALLLAVGGSILLICQGPPAHRRRVVIWYGLSKLDAALARPGYATYPEMSGRGTGAGGALSPAQPATAAANIPAVTMRRQRALTSAVPCHPAGSLCGVCRSASRAVRG